MQKTPFSTARILTIVVFSLSCFGLLLFLWITFGGSTPLRARGYQITVKIPEAATLAEQADVRISGVPVGKVVKVQRSRDVTKATLRIQPRYVPLHEDVRATLRFKTLLGETFVELTPGSRSAPPIAEGGHISRPAVLPTTEVDEVLSTFDPPTRRNLRAWLTGWSSAVHGRAGDIQGAVAGLAPLAQDGGDVLARLDAQGRALDSLVRNAGSVFRTVGAREQETRRLVLASEQLFAATASRGPDLRATLRAVPPLLRAARPGLAALESISREAHPVVRALEPVAPLVRPVLAGTIQTAPEVRRVIRDVGRLSLTGPDDLRSLRPVLRAAGPLTGALYPFARDLIPVVQYAALYRQELISSWPVLAASSQFTTQRPGQKPLHYFRAVLPLSDENFVVAGQPSETRRANAYAPPRWLDGLSTGLTAFDCRHVSDPRGDVGAGSPPPCVTAPPTRFQGQLKSFPQLQRAAP
jgi:virulence factor Mce-like protein